jgi:hypothetical protein
VAKGLSPSGKSLSNATPAIPLWVPLSEKWLTPAETVRMPEGYPPLKKILVQLDDEMVISFAETNRVIDASRALLNSVRRSGWIWRHRAEAD